MRLPDLRRVPPWPERIRGLPLEWHRALVTLAHTDPVAMDADGHLYLAVHDREDGALRYRLAKFDREGRRTTLAGSTTGFADGQGEAAQFASISAIAVGPSGAVYLADGNPQVGSRIRRVRRSVAGSRR